MAASFLAKLGEQPQAVLQRIYRALRCSSDQFLQVMLRSTLSSMSLLWKSPRSFILVELPHVPDPQHESNRQAHCVHEQDRQYSNKAFDLTPTIPPFLDRISVRSREPPRRHATKPFHSYTLLCATKEWYTTQNRRTLGGIFGATRVGQRRFVNVSSAQHGWHP